MRWLELSIDAPGEYAEPIVHLFTKHAEGGAVVELAGGFNPDEGESPDAGGPATIRAYLPVDSTTKSRKVMIDVGLRLIAYLCPLPPVREREVDESEWRNQKFDPVRVGKRLVIAPPGSDVTTGPGDIVIPLEPGMAFGTGHHPTTAMVLQAMESASLDGVTVLDAGCGSGILSIAAVKLGASEVVGIDVDEDAVRSSTANLARAEVSDAARVIHTTLPSPGVPNGHFDFVLANISANVLITLATHLLDALKPGGTLIGSGVLDTRWDEVKAGFEEAGATITETVQTGDWMCFSARRV